MKLSDARPCDNCGNPLLRPGSINFYVVRTCMALVNPAAANAVLGTMRIVGGALAIAEAIAPQSEAIIITGDKEPKLMTELFLCMECYTRNICLASLVEEKSK